MDNYRRSSYIAGTFTAGGPDQSEADADRVELALKFAEALARQQGWKTVWFVTDTTQGLHSADISAVLPPQQIKALSAKRPISRDGVTEMRHVTKATMGSRMQGAIVALHPSEQLLNQLDEHHEDHALIVVPWTGEHYQLWAETWGAMNLETGEFFSRPLIDDADVREQLNDLVNESDHGSLKYPSDLSMFREMFKRLEKEGHRFNVSAVRSFVIVDSYRGVEVAEKIAKAAGPLAVKEKGDFI
jgi:hypothetical protein